MFKKEKNAAEEPAGGEVQPGESPLEGATAPAESTLTGSGEATAGIIAPADTASSAQAQPPIDNDHVEEGAEKFTAAEIAANAKTAPPSEEVYDPAKAARPRHHLEHIEEELIKTWGELVTGSENDAGRVLHWIASRV